MPFSRELLLAARKRRGLSQSRLAELADVKLQTLRAMEQGRTPNPTGDTVEAIAEALDVRMDELYTGSNPDAVAVA